MAFHYCPDCGSSNLKESFWHPGKGEILDCVKCGMRHHVIEEEAETAQVEEATAS